MHTVKKINWFTVFIIKNKNKNIYTIKKKKKQKEDI